MSGTNSPNCVQLSTSYICFIENMSNLGSTPSIPKTLRSIMVLVLGADSTAEALGDDKVRQNRKNSVPLYCSVTGGSVTVVQHR